MKIIPIYLLNLIFWSIIILSCNRSAEKKKHEAPKSSPKIINIVNFIRQIEPRDEKITNDVLYQTVVKQIESMKKYELKGTFLLQYDALMDKKYQELLKELPKKSFEIGAWWEIPQPLVEKAGLKWRGRFPWDWHPDVGFSTGYTPQEREKLVDVYMEDFKEIYGYYPKSIASWFIDTHTLNYLYEKYHIMASANCKDQFGTDGYTLWGGYWNQAYYPSKLNSFMPAQNEENQIPVPVFRMLGSDPVRQYDTGLQSERQGVITLEPVYKDAGGNKAWVDWYFKEFIEGEAMEFAYTQAGQENSFTWDGMKDGFEIQMPLIAKLRDEGKVKVETLKESGNWFKKNYKITPATSVTVTEDLGDSNLKTVWFNSRFYRLNLLWDEGSLRFRDIHLFDENIPSPYLNKKLETNKALFFTQPIVDGYLWSTKEEFAGLRFNTKIDGQITALKGGTPEVNSPQKGELHISWPLNDGNGIMKMKITESEITITLENSKIDTWFLDLTAPINAAELPFKSIQKEVIKSEFQDKKYSLKALQGQFSVPNSDIIYRITPENNTIKLDLSERQSI
ncbi:hypothetical protein [Echinicola shivajiensis]|uniref:hypothetical protein n=1 Tax=Echinicola shivajiensis TaxID=1035916 RepID=UPI001BFC873B|nr:hypothetical protein [Echinicola shivajiensis]